MRSVLLTTAAAAVSMALAAPAFAQEETTGGGTSFRGIRIEGNFGGDRFQSEGVHNDEFGFGGTVGFDGMIGDKIVIGAEGSYWRGADWNENCSVNAASFEVCRKSFEEWGAAIRAGVMATPQTLVFVKGGYVNNEQRKYVIDPAGIPVTYQNYGSDGYQLGGGVEQTLTAFGSLPVYANVQYVYSNYVSHSSRHRIMGGVGIRFK